MQYMTAVEVLQKVLNFVATGKHPISRRSLKEVELEEQRLLAEEMKLEAEKAALREKHQTQQGKRYREGSFDNGSDAHPAKTVLDPLNAMGRIDR